MDDKVSALFLFSQNLDATDYFIFSHSQEGTDQASILPTLRERNPGK